MLRGFVSHQADAVQQLREQLAAGDRAGAERTAHTLKGLAGNIGADALQLLADGVEHALSPAQAGTARASVLAQQLEPQLAQLAQVLAQQIAAIEAALPAPEQAPAVQYTPAQREQLVAELKALLADDDARCAHLLDEHHALFAAVFPQQFGALEQAIHEFDMELALQLLGGASASEVNQSAQS